MQPDEEVGDALRDAADRAGDELARDDEAAREREVEVARDEGVRQLAALADDPDRLDRGDRLVLERSEEAVLPLRDALGQLLEGEELAVVVHEADDVGADAAGRDDEALVVPVVERLAPGEVEEVRVAGAGDQLDAHCVSRVAEH